MNDALRIAMAEAGETAESLADRVGVDPKTAARWPTPGRVPHPRHRAAVSAALGREVGELWPDVVRRREPVMAQRPRVLLHVLPLRAGCHPGQAGPFVIASTDGGEDVAYLDDQAAGHTTKDGAALWQVWDTLRSVALPRDQTIQLLKARPWLT